MAWLVSCMYWLGFVYPRSHPGWIGPIGEFEGASIRTEPAYRYSIPLHPDFPSILTHRLAFLSEIVPVRWRDLIFVCFDWVLYTPGPIPAELGQLANLQHLRLSCNKLTGAPSLFHLTWLQYEGIGLRSSVKSYQYDSVTWFLYVLTGFCIPQVPFLLNWAN